MSYVLSECIGYTTKVLYIDVIHSVVLPKEMNEQFTQNVNLERWIATVHSLK